MKLTRKVVSGLRLRFRDGKPYQSMEQMAVEILTYDNGHRTVLIPLKVKPRS